MDMTTAMMGSTIPIPTTGFTAEGGTSQPLTIAESSLFAGLLETSLQGELPVNLQADSGPLATPSPALPLGDNLGSHVPTDGRGAPPLNRTLSVMQLLNGLRNEISSPQEAKGPESVSAMLEELQNFVGQNGQMDVMLQKQLKGRLNPSGMKREETLLALMDEPENSGTGEENARAPVEALLALVNGLIPQVPQQALEQNLATDEVPRPAGSVDQLMPGQQKAAYSKEIVPSEPPETSQTSFSTMLPGAPAELSESGATLHNTARKDSGNADEIIPETTVSSIRLSTTDFGATIKKTAETTHEEMTTACIDTTPPLAEMTATTPKQEPRNLEPLEVPAMEESPPTELPRVAVQEKDSAPAVTHETSRPEVFLAPVAEGKTQITAALPDQNDTRAGVPGEEILRQVKQKLTELPLSSENGQITLRLHPAELGELKISVRMEDQRLRVEIVADNNSVRDALRENAGSLKESLLRQNLDMVQFDVSTGSKHFFHQGFREGRHEQQFVAPGNTTWLTGRSNEPEVVTANSLWQPSEKGLLDIMM